MKSTGIVRKVDELGRIVLPIELRRTLETVDYKCWFYETAQEVGTVAAPQSMTVEDIPEEHRKTYRRLKELVE